MHTTVKVKKLTDLYDADEIPETHIDVIPVEDVDWILIVNFNAIFEPFIAEILKTKQITYFLGLC